MSNLLSSLMNSVGDELVGKASSLLGEKEDNTRSALTGILPTLMGGLINNAQDERGAQGILDTITRNNFNGGLLDNVSELFNDRTKVNSMMDNGGSLLTDILGGNLNNIIDSIAGFAGIGRNSSNSLLKMAAPFLMSMIGKKVFNDNLDARGLMGLLNNQKSHVNSMLPAGLASIGSMLGFSNLGNIGDRIDRTVDRTTDQVHSGADRTVIVDNDKRKSGGFAWWPWLLLLLLGAALLWFLLGRDPEVRNELNEAGEDIENVAENAAEGVEKGLENTGDAIDNAADNVMESLRSIRLPDGEEIEADANSFTYKINRFFAGEETEVNEYVFDRVTFETGSDRITAESARQLDDLATLMKAYRDREVLIEGHTDNTGNAEINNKLSKDRAEAVKMALVNRGVAAGRIDAEGRGSSEPVATNDTEEGRAQNRRVSVTVTK